MDTKSRLTKVLLYQNIGFLAVILLGYLDDLLKLPSLIFGHYPFTWEFGKSTVGLLLVLAVWLLVTTSTRRLLQQVIHLEKFIRVCAWCHHIDYKGQWMSMEDFMQQGFDTPTSHGICPKCLEQQKAAMARASAGKLEQTTT